MEADRAADGIRKFRVALPAANWLRRLMNSSGGSPFFWKAVMCAP